MIIKFKPVFLKKIWGGERLAKLYNVKMNNIGECWGISGHEKNSNKIINGIYKGLTLRQIYERNKELFGNYKSEEFPILIKYIDAKKDLSIQVHPNNDYALKNENSYGKEECWLILDTKPKSKVIIGHSATSTNQIRNSLHNKTIMSLLNSHKIKKNDYFYIPAGTVHAICAGTFLIEVSQSSDVTYRLYDYERK